MDPMLMQMLMHYRQQGGMFGGQPQMGQPQLPAMGQAPGTTQGDPTDPSAQPQSHHHGFNPLMLLSPMGGLMASNPKIGMSLMSPAFGLANLFGAFK